MEIDNESQRKDPSDKVTEQMKVYVTEDEKEFLMFMVDQLSMSFSSYARQTLLDMELDINIKTLQLIRYELNKIGSNINQLARKANASGQIQETELLEQTLHKLIQKLEEL